MAIHFLLAAFSVTTDDELALKGRREEDARAGADRALARMLRQLLP